MVGDKKLLDVDALLRIARIGPPKARGDGAIAFNVARPQPEENKDLNELWIVWPDGSRTYYTGEGDAAPAWGPEGALAFISRRGAGEKEKGVGVFIVGRGGDPRRAAWFRHGVWRLEWMGDRLVVGSWRPEEKLYDPDGDYVATRRLPLWFNGQGLVAGRTRQAYLLDPDSGRVEEATREPLGITGYTVCGDSIVYTVPLDWRDPTLHALRRVVPGGEPETILEGYSISRLRCIRGTLYFTGHRKEIGIASHDKLYRVAGNGAECLTCGVLDRNIWSLEEGPGGAPLIVYADHGLGVPALLRDGRVEPLPAAPLSVYYATYGGGRYYLLAASPRAPTDIYTLPEAGGEPRRLTRFNAWIEEEYRLAAPRKVTVEAAGDVVEGWVLLPPEGAPSHGERRPLILFIHGGPKGMYGPVFHGEHQLFAAQGFIVAANPRGSDGYEEEFADIRGRYGEVDYEQLMAFLDRVVREYPVDTGRMVVTGISYGGYMTNVVVTKTKRFAAAVPENGIADWIADYWAADIGYWFDPDQIGGTPLDNLEEYVRRSPAFHAANVETPVLTIHSLEDYRCFIDQALAMHTALSTLGKDSTLLVFTRGDHGHSVRAPPRHRKKRLDYKLSWIREKLGLDDKA